MTNLEHLIESFNEASKEFGKENTGILLFLKMPDGETEMLANPNGLKKIAYIAETYTENLKHKNNENVSIVGSNFFDSSKEVDITICLGKGKED